MEFVVKKWVPFNLGMLAAGALFMVGVLIYSVDNVDSVLSPYFLKLLCWVCAPFALAAVVVFRWKDKQNVSDIVTFVSVVLAASSVWLSIDGFIIHDGALGGMGAWAWPILQLMTAALFFSYAKMARM